MALGSPGNANRPTMINDQVGEHDPVFPVNDLLQFKLDLDRILLPGKLEQIGDPDDMGVHHDPRNMESGTQDDIGRFPANTGQLDQGFQIGGHFSPMLLQKHPGTGTHVPGFAVKETGGSHQFSQVFHGCSGHSPGSGIVFKEFGSDLVDPVVGALGREHG